MRFPSAVLLSCFIAENTAGRKSSSVLHTKARKNILRRCSHLRQTSAPNNALKVSVSIPPVQNLPLLSREACNMMFKIVLSAQSCPLLTCSATKLLSGAIELRAGGTVFGGVYTDTAAVNFFSVHRTDCAFRCRIVGKFHKSEALGLLRHSVVNHNCRNDLSKL